MSFSEALEKTLRFEGGYSKHPLDRGGETYCGISRISWPDWSGWKHVDTAMAHGFRPDLPEENPAMYNLVVDFYRDNFWEPLRCDEICDQKVAAYLFDTAVNMGRQAAVRILQRVIGVITDGILGEKTLAALNAVDIDMTELRARRIEAYMKIIARTPSQSVFALGWARRAIA